MTILPMDRAPTPAPARASQLAPSPALQRPAAAGLGAVIATGLRALNDLHSPSPDVSSGELARALHTAVARHEQRAALTPGADHLVRVAISVRIAGAYLDAGDLVDARLALESAHHALPHRDRQTADDAAAAQSDADARAVSEAQQRDLGASAVIAQAAGVLAEHTGAGPAQARTALRDHAERHRFVLSELANDVVSGRVALDAVLDSARCAPTVRRRRTT